MLEKIADVVEKFSKDETPEKKYYVDKHGYFRVGTEPKEEIRKRNFEKKFDVVIKNGLIIATIVLGVRVIQLTIAYFFPHFSLLTTTVDYITRLFQAFAY